MRSSLPEDVVIQILQKLPIKTLLICRCVCKSWYSLLTSPTFIFSHMKHTQFHYVIIQRWNELTGHFHFTLHKDNHTLDWMHELDPPFPVTTNNRFHRILGCINGLVCLLDDTKVNDRLLLWNPLIKKVLILPNFSIEGNWWDCSCFGFGFDPLDCEYKVVRVVYVEVGSFVEVFRLKARSWARIDVSSIGSMPSIVSQQVYVNGCVNWVTSSHMILAFEVGNEVFKEMVLPKGLEKVYGLELTVVVWKGFLSMFVYERRWDDVGRTADGRVFLWVMREYGVVESWTMQFLIEPFPVFRQVRGIQTNGDIVFEDFYGNLICYDLGTKRSEHLALLGEGTLSGFCMESYKESLVLLDMGERQLMPPGLI